MLFNHLVNDIKVSLCKSQMQYCSPKLILTDKSLCCVTYILFYFQLFQK